MAEAALDLGIAPDILYQQLTAELSLRGYIQEMWSVLEPGREFKTGWSVDAICEHLEAVTSGQINRLMINVPPGTMKSLTTEVFWPTWEWGPKNLPSQRYVSGSYSEALTVRDNRKARMLIQSDKYQQLWGDRFHLMGDQNAKQKFENNKTGWKLATSVSGLGTGERGDRFIIDDPHNVKDGESEAKREQSLLWFAETVPTRINDPETSAIIVIMQRIHERDVSGLILAQELNYDHLMLPMNYEPERKCYVRIKPKYMGAGVKPEPVVFDKQEKAWRDPKSIIKDRLENNLPEEDIKQELNDSRKANLYPADPRKEDGELLWPNRFSEHHVEQELKPQLMSVGGTYAISGQLQQRPVPRGGGMFQRGDFNFLTLAEADGLVGRVVRGWDLAASDTKTASNTASCKGMIDQYGRIVILDVTAFQKLPGAVLAEIKDIAKQDGPEVQQDVPQDPGQAGKSQKHYLVKEIHGVNMKFSPESGDKTVRATPLSTQAEAGNLYLVRGPWNDGFINEATSFPNGMFKDRIDAASRMYANLNRFTTDSFAIGGKLHGG